MMNRLQRLGLTAITVMLTISASATTQTLATGWQMAEGYCPVYRDGCVDDGWCGA